MSIKNIVAPFDPTGYTQISGAQLKQLIDGAQAYTDKGFIIITTDGPSGSPLLPDVTNNPDLKRYIWLRISVTKTTPYVWVESTPNPGLDHWQSISVSSIGPNSITGDMIAQNTITHSNIVTINADQISGSIFGYPAASQVVCDTDPAGGALTGTYPNPSLANGAVSDTNKIAPNIITLDRIARTSIAGYIFVSGGTSADPSYQRIDSANPALNLDGTTGDAKKIIAANDLGTAYIKRSISELLPAAPVSTVKIASVAVPNGTYSNGNVIASLYITPSALNHVFRITFSGTAYHTTAARNCGVLLKLTPYGGSATQLMASITASYNADPNTMSIAYLHIDTNTSIKQLLFQLVVSTNDVLTINTNEKSTLIVEEIATSVVGSEAALP